MEPKSETSPKALHREAFTFRSIGTSDRSPGIAVTKCTWRGRGPSKSFISRVSIGVTPFRVLITLLITYLLSPLPLQVVWLLALLSRASAPRKGLGILIIMAFRILMIMTPSSSSSSLPSSHHGGDRRSHLTSEIKDRDASQL